MQMCTLKVKINPEFLCSNSAFSGNPFPPSSMIPPHSQLTAASSHLSSFSTARPDLSTRPKHKKEKNKRSELPLEALEIVKQVRAELFCSIHLVMPVLQLTFS